jgi:hypothetical protein
MCIAKRSEAGLASAAELAKVVEETIFRGYLMMSHA